MHGIFELFAQSCDFLLTRAATATIIRGHAGDQPGIGLTSSTDDQEQPETTDQQHGATGDDAPGYGLERRNATDGDVGPDQPQHQAQCQQADQTDEPSLFDERHVVRELSAAPD